MNNLIKLTKINLKGMFKKNDKKGSRGALLLLVAFIYLGYCVYFFASMAMDGFIALNIPYLILVQFMIITSLFILFTGIFKVGGTLFNFRDYDLLMSLPIKKSTIITSKALILYLANLIYSLLFMIPVFIAFILKVNVGIPFYILFIITLFIIPVVPTVISAIIGTIITGISSRFKRKNIMNYIFYILLFVGAMSLSFSMENMEALDIANIGKQMTLVFNKIYPLTIMYLNILEKYNILSLLLYILIPTLIFLLFIFVLNKYYIVINNGLSSFKKNNNFKLGKMNKTSPLIALYKKELKRYFSSVNYVMNTAIGPIMITLAVLGLVFIGSDKVTEYLQIPGLSEMIMTSAPLFLAMFTSLSCTTHSAISLEGNKLWIPKSLPVNEKTIFLSKILVNLTVIIPLTFIDALVLAIYLKTSFYTTILMFIMPSIYAMFISIFGLVINIHFPSFDWKNEVQVIKQSLSSFLTIFVGLIFVIIPFVIKPNMSSDIYLTLVALVMLIITGILYYHMNTKGTKLFRKM